MQHKFSVSVRVMPRPEILDPQGKATELALHNLGFAEVEQVRIGKFFTFQIEAPHAEAAAQQAHAAARKLLANPVIETFDVLAVEALESGVS